MNRSPWKVGTKEIVLMGIGAVVFAALSWLTNSVAVAGISLRPGQAVLTFFGYAFGPVVGFVVGTVGNLLNDLISGSFWWNWDLGNGLVGLVAGLWYLKRNYSEPGKLNAMDYIMLSVVSIIANFVGLYFAGGIDVLMGTPYETALGAWALPAAATNAALCIILTPILLIAWRSRQASTKAFGD